MNNMPVHAGTWHLSSLCTSSHQMNSGERNKETKINKVRGGRWICCTPASSLHPGIHSRELLRWNKYCTHSESMSAVVAHTCHVYLNNTHHDGRWMKASQCFSAPNCCVRICATKKQINKLYPVYVVGRKKYVYAAVWDPMRDSVHAMWTYYLLKFEFIGVSMKNRLAHTIVHWWNNTPRIRCHRSRRSRQTFTVYCIEIRAFHTTFKAHYGAIYVCDVYAT